MFEHVKYDVSAAKQHFTKGKRTHLELTFIDAEVRKFYATNGINIENKTYFGYVPTDGRKTFLPIKCRNVPLGNRLDISDALLSAFEDVGKIASIKPLLIDGTPYATDQWIIVFETTHDPELENNIPRFTYVLDNKVTTEWRSASKVCYFCEGEGHIKRECSQFAAAVEQRRRLRERRLEITPEVSETQYRPLEEDQVTLESNQMPEANAAEDDQIMGEVQEQKGTEGQDTSPTPITNSEANLLNKEEVTVAQEQIETAPTGETTNIGKEPLDVPHPQNGQEPMVAELKEVVEVTKTKEADLEGFKTVSYRKQAKKQGNLQSGKNASRNAPTKTNGVR